MAIIRAENCRSLRDTAPEDHKGLPGCDEHLARKWAELEAKAAGDC
jgi:hypothetical protein